MINVLLDSIDFHLPYARPALEKIITPDLRVLIIPYAFDGCSMHDEECITSSKDWDERYGTHGRYTPRLLDPFFSYGIARERIRFLNYFEDDDLQSARKIEESDLLFFNGGYPEKILERLKERNLLTTVEAHGGILMGWSAGALIQCESFFISPDEDTMDYSCVAGLRGFIPSFAVEVHYTGANVQRESMERFQSETGKDAYTLQPESALVVQDGEILHRLGNAALYGSGRESRA